MSNNQWVTAALILADDWRIKVKAAMHECHKTSDWLSSRTGLSVSQLRNLLHNKETVGAIYEWAIIFEALNLYPFGQPADEVIPSLPTSGAFPPPGDVKIATLIPQCGEQKKGLSYTFCTKREGHGGQHGYGGMFWGEDLDPQEAINRRLDEAFRTILTIKEQLALHVPRQEDVTAAFTSVEKKIKKMQTHTHQNGHTGMPSD